MWLMGRRHGAEEPHSWETTTMATIARLKWWQRALSEGEALERAALQARDLEAYLASSGAPGWEHGAGIFAGTVLSLGDPSDG
jgi:hypothetical protein